MLQIILLLLSIALIVLGTSKLKIHPFLALLFATLFYGIFSGMPLQELVESINRGFGDTIGKVGIIILTGVIIGAFLEKSGGAHAMARKVLKLTGKKQVPLSMALIGYIISIPVFADSGFIILNPLNRALSKEAGLSLAGTASALMLGLTITHVLVPPTPGPIAAAGILGANLGLVIMLGVLTSIPVLGAAWLFATKFAAKIPLDPSNGKSEEVSEKVPTRTPSAMKAFLPILLPIILIVLKSIGDFPTQPFGDGHLYTTISFIGNPVIALVLGMLLSFTLPEKLERHMLSTTGWVGKALQSAAIIILITGAGGAFGMVLRDSEIGETLGTALAGMKIGIFLPFIIAAALKCAQGSSTVALITAASLIAPMTAMLGFDSERALALVVLATGAGSMVVSHANDSGFWIFTQLTGMDVKTGFKVQTLGTAVIGFTAILVIWILNLILL